MESVKIKCRYAIEGKVKAEVMFSNDTFSFWGGVERETGIVTDKRHANYGESMSKKVFVFPYGKGSTSAGTTLMEMAQLGTAPAAIINIQTDPVLLSGPLIAKFFYEKVIPVVNVSSEDYKKLEDAKVIEFFEGSNYIEIIK